MTVTTTSTCSCGKVAFHDQAAAASALTKAKLRHHLRGAQQRRETATYQCPTNPTLWHLTSVATELPDYPPDDDTTAEKFIARFLSTPIPREATWDALLAPDRVRQTVRVLKQIRKPLLETRNGPLWKTWDSDRRGAHLDREHLINQRLHEATAAQKRLNVTEHQNKYLAESEHHRRTLQRLAVAIARHRAETPDPIEADRQLWGWLTILTVPDGPENTPTSLQSLIDNGSWYTPPVDPKESTSCPR